MKKTLPTIAALLIFGAFAASSNAEIIAVLDSAPVSGGTLYDESTGVDDIGTITGSFSGTALQFANSNFTEYWNAPGDTNATPGFLDGTGFMDSATWLFSNLPVNTLVEVYVNWTQLSQGNLTTAQYNVNGGADIFVDQLVAVPSDLTIADPDGQSINFASLGEFSTGATGQISLVATDSVDVANGAYVSVDAAAVVIPEPSSIALLGLAALSILLLFRRK